MSENKGRVIGGNLDGEMRACAGSFMRAVPRLPMLPPTIWPDEAKEVPVRYETYVWVSFGVAPQGFWRHESLTNDDALALLLEHYKP